MSTTIRTYSELVQLKTFEERYEYLKLDGVVGRSTFGYDRWLNQVLYTSKEWRMLRNDIIIRDLGLDLGIVGRDIIDSIIVHHMNPITIEDVKNKNPKIFNPEFLICVSDITHKAIHYGDASLLINYTERKPGDTRLW